MWAAPGLLLRPCRCLPTRWRPQPQAQRDRACLLRSRPRSSDIIPEAWDFAVSRSWSPPGLTTPTQNLGCENLKRTFRFTSVVDRHAGGWGDAARHLVTWISRLRSTTSAHRSFFSSCDTFCRGSPRTSWTTCRPSTWPITARRGEHLRPFCGWNVATAISETCQFAMMPTRQKLFRLVLSS